MHLRQISKTELNSYFTEREGEKRLGQTVTLPGELFSVDALRSLEARFVMIGIPEDIGVRANCGRPGTADFWKEFLGVFLNIQSNSFLKGEEILLLGEIDCTDLNQHAGDKKTVELSVLVEEVDQRVYEVMTEIFKAEKIPVIIGGGHNNAYPIIKALHNAQSKKVNIINIDPHADLRATENRHSGNGFSTALQHNFINFYLQVGLHESYNNQHILDLYTNNPGHLFYLSFDNYLKGKWDLTLLKSLLKDHFTSAITGLEVDADAIEGYPSSAQTPTGFSPNDVRSMLMTFAAHASPVYFHLPESIPSVHPFNSMKMASYLVTDFIKNHGKNN